MDLNKPLNGWNFVLNVICIQSPTHIIALPTSTAKNKRKKNSSNSISDGREVFVVRSSLNWHSIHTPACTWKILISGQIFFLVETPLRLSVFVFVFLLFWIASQLDDEKQQKNMQTYQLIGKYITFYVPTMHDTIFSSLFFSLSNCTHQECIWRHQTATYVYFGWFALFFSSLVFSWNAIIPHSMRCQQQLEKKMLFFLSCQCWLPLFLCAMLGDGGAILMVSLVIRYYFVKLSV